MLLDTIGCALGAWREDPRKARIARGLAEEFASPGQATVIGGNTTHPALAALANGILSNAADNDDTHKRALIHVGSVVVPAALAMCEQLNLGGRDLILAMVAGYEITARVGLAVMPTHYRFWHSTATNGTFGAAAAAAKALRLDAAQARAALGFAGTQAAGLNAFFESGDDTKSLHPGKAGMNGVLAARLAALGGTAPPDIFGHPKGYLAAFSAEPDAAALTHGLGEVWEVNQNGYKPYPSILASHSPIGATLEIVRRDSPPAERIRSISVETYATVKSHFSSKAVDSTMAARLSVPYCVAVACVDGTVTQRQFAAERFRDPLVRRLLEATEVIADAELNKLYPEKFPARVTLVLDDGTRLSAEMMYPKGDPQNPMSDAELEVKFRENAAGVLDAAATDELLEFLRAVPQAAGLAPLGTLLRAHKG
jgi:2-methylcitrate dehydratase PrpD